ncbi:MAG: hypothetical protein ACREBJ_06410 [Nitrosotalea sp.]
MIEPRLGPDKCLKRWCRICGKEMELKYNFNPENRVMTLAAQDVVLRFVSLRR